MPCWQYLQEDINEVNPVTAIIERNLGYGGVSITINQLEVYIENDQKRGIVVRIWTDKDSGKDPTFIHDFKLIDISAAK